MTQILNAMNCFDLIFFAIQFDHIFQSNHPSVQSVEKSVVKSIGSVSSLDLRNLCNSRPSAVQASSVRQVGMRVQPAPKKCLLTTF